MKKESKGTPETQDWLEGNPSYFKESERMWRLNLVVNKKLRNQADPTKQ